jgi:serine/threonine protein kinase
VPLDDDEAERECVTELRVLRRASHPNIVAFYASYRTPHELWLAMEFIEYSTTTIMARLNEPFAELEIALILRETLKVG